MKYFISHALALLLLLSLVGCTGRAAALPDGEALPEQTSVPVSAEEDLTIPGPSPEEDPPAEEAVGQPAEAAEPEKAAEPEEAATPEEPYVRVIDPSKPMVALTFDDGPHKTCTDEILDILEENHALATFFEVGRNVQRYPEPVARAYEMGCEIGSHSNTHRNLGKMKKAAILKDLEAADAAFTAAGIPAPTLVRPPYGSVNKAVKSQTGRTMVTWSIDTEDWKSKDAQKVIASVQNAGNLDGHVVLMHSIYESTVEATAVLVPWLQEQGYQLVTVSELMAYYYGELPQPDKLYGYTYFFKNGRTDTPLELPAGEPEEVPAA